ncbi:MAG: hypothetical protein II007_10685 [Gammaproteobacteria bacterium]|nr:hypothetical protein [Gammaproteobacteria bacterium]
MNGSNVWALARAALQQSHSPTAVPVAGSLIECGGTGLQPHLATVRAALNQPGWLALVAPPSRQLITPLLMDGVDPNRLLWVHQSSTLDAVWAAEQALLARRCALVICWTDNLGERDRKRLLLAARRSGGSVLLLTAAAAQQSRAPQATPNLTLAGLALH